MKIETKYDVGQEVWFMRNKNPFKSKIDSIEIRLNADHTVDWYYYIEMFVFSGDGLFSTKAALLSSLV